MFNRKLKEEVKALRSRTVALQEQIDDWRTFSMKTEGRLNALLAHLGLHEITEPATPEKRKFLTEEEYKEWEKENNSKTESSHWSNPLFGPAESWPPNPFPYFWNMYKDNH